MNHISRVVAEERAVFTNDWTSGGNCALRPERRCVVRMKEDSVRKFTSPGQIDAEYFAGTFSHREGLHVGR